MASREMPKSMKYAMESRLTKLFQRAQTFLYRASGGKLAGTMQGAPILLLTTRGRKTRKPRTVPLIYVKDRQNFAVVASKGGWPDDPLWYKNLKADPNVEIEVDGSKRSLRARTADATERARIWPQAVSVYKAYDDYQSWTDREIPVVILTEAS